MSDPSPLRHPELLERLATANATVGVVGLGYVGLPVAEAFALAGFRVVGVDDAAERVAALQEGSSYIADLTDEDVRELRDSGRFDATTDYERLRDADAILISVPTPLTEGSPDLSAIMSAGTAIGRVLKSGCLVVLESTTYPGTTDELLRPLLEIEGRSAGADFLLAYSPERIDPGNPDFGFRDIPKIVGGIDAESTQAAEALYSKVVPKVVPVSGTREAEMAKLIENTYRHVNIALVNELAMYAHEWDIDVWEAIEAAATKPFGFTPFWPGPGWGGHCIPLDPSYLSWRVRREHSHEMRFVELAQTVNAEMPGRVVQRISWLLNDSGKSVRGSRILGVGVAYKGGTDDTRGSAGVKVLRALRQKGAAVAYHDPLVPELMITDENETSTPLEPARLEGFDLVVVFVPQKDVDWRALELHSTRILDCCNAFGKKTEKVVRF